MMLCTDLVTGVEGERTFWLHDPQLALPDISPVPFTLLPLDEDEPWLPVHSIRAGPVSYTHLTLPTILLV